MDLLLVSARTPDPTGHPDHSVTAAFAAGLVARGHRVRWLCPQPPSASPPVVAEGVELTSVHSCPPSFRQVTARLEDLACEQQLVRMLREDPPELVHILAYGGANSHLLAWTADRLGVATVISADDRAALFCHRGDLRHAGATACDDWSDPKRCRDCVVQAAPGGLTYAQATMAKMLAFLRGLSPYPAANDFESRADMIALGLTAADRVMLEDEASAATLRSWGVPARSFRIGAPNADDIDGWLSIYAEASERHD